jgi:hypothetical protein
VSFPRHMCFSFFVPASWGHPPVVWGRSALFSMVASQDGGFDSCSVEVR